MTEYFANIYCLDCRKALHVSGGSSYYVSDQVQRFYKIHEGHEIMGLVPCPGSDFQFSPLDNGTEWWKGQNWTERSHCSPEEYQEHFRFSFELHMMRRVGESVHDKEEVDQLLSLVEATTGTSLSDKVRQALAYSMVLVSEGCAVDKGFPVIPAATTLYSLIEIFQASAVSYADCKQAIGMFPARTIC